MLREQITWDSQMFFWLLQEINKRGNTEINNHKPYSYSYSLKGTFMAKNIGLVYSICTSWKEWGTEGAFHPWSFANQIWTYLTIKIFNF